MATIKEMVKVLTKLEKKGFGDLEVLFQHPDKKYSIGVSRQSWALATCDDDGFCQDVGKERSTKIPSGESPQVVNFRYR